LVHSSQRLSFLRSRKKPFLASVGFSASGFFVGFIQKPNSRSNVPLFFQALHSLQHCCSVNKNNIEHHNSMMEVNEDDVIVYMDHNIPADTTDIINSKGPEH
jgi:hypothetical protein